MTDTPAKCMLDDINADLKTALTAKGTQKIAELISERWGMPAEEVAPYIVAVCLQVGLTYDAQLAAEPIEAFKRLESLGYNTVRAAVAAERVGWNQIEEDGIQLGPYTSATQLAADAFADTKDEGELEH